MGKEVNTLKEVVTLKITPLWNRLGRIKTGFVGEINKWSIRMWWWVGVVGGVSLSCISWWEFLSFTVLIHWHLKISFPLECDWLSQRVLLQLELSCSPALICAAAEFSPTRPPPSLKKKKRIKRAKKECRIQELRGNSAFSFWDCVGRDCEFVWRQYSDMMTEAMPTVLLWLNELWRGVKKNKTKNSTLTLIGMQACFSFPCFLLLPRRKIAKFSSLLFLSFLFKYGRLCDTWMVCHRLDRDVLGMFSMTAQKQTHTHTQHVKSQQSSWKSIFQCMYAEHIHRERMMRVGQETDLFMGVCSCKWNQRCVCVCVPFVLWWHDENPIHTFIHHNQHL